MEGQSLLGLVDGSGAVSCLVVFSKGKRDVCSRQKVVSRSRDWKSGSAGRFAGWIPRGVDWTDDSKVRQQKMRPHLRAATETA